MEMLQNLNNAANVQVQNNQKQYATMQKNASFENPQIKSIDADTVEISSKEKSKAKPKLKTVEKVGKGLSSAVFPGLGQVCNGELLKGFAFLAGTVAPLLFGIPIVSLGIHIWSIVDAVKKA